MMLLLIALLTCASRLRTSHDSYVGFLTIDGRGLADNPFSTDAKYSIDWKDEGDRWTAMPVRITGKLEDNTIQDAVQSELKYKNLNSKAELYRALIEGGHQEKFEDLWCEVYDILNRTTVHKTIDGTVVTDILRIAYSSPDDNSLRDIMTDAVALVKDVNENGPTTEYNTEAGLIYNAFYSWMHSISLEDFGKK